MRTHLLTTDGKISCGNYNAYHKHFTKDEKLVDCVTCIRKIQRERGEYRGDWNSKHEITKVRELESERQRQVKKQRFLRSKTINYYLSLGKNN